MTFRPVPPVRQIFSIVKDTDRSREVQGGGRRQEGRCISLHGLRFRTRAFTVIPAGDYAGISSDFHGERARQARGRQQMDTIIEPVRTRRVVKIFNNRLTCFFRILPVDLVGFSLSTPLSIPSINPKKRLSRVHQCTRTHQSSIS